jgi:hypothetical protein
VAGTYSLALVVNDGSVDSVPDSVTVTAGDDSDGSGGGGGCTLGARPGAADPLLLAMVVLPLSLRLLRKRAKIRQARGTPSE